MQDVGGRIRHHTQLAGQRHLGHIGHLLAGLVGPARNGRILIRVGTVEHGLPGACRVEPQVELLVGGVRVVVPMEGHLSVVVGLVGAGAASRTSVGARGESRGQGADGQAFFVEEVGTGGTALGHPVVGDCFHPVDAPVRPKVPEADARRVLRVGADLLHVTGGMVDAHARIRAGSARIPTGVVHVPAGRNGVLGLVEQEVGPLEVAALDVVGIGESDDPRTATVEQSIAFAALRPLVVVVDLEQGEIVVIGITAQRGGEHVPAAIEGRRIDHGARAQVGPAVLDDGEAHGRIALALPPLDFGTGHIDFAGRTAAPTPATSRNRAAAPSMWRRTSPVKPAGTDRRTTAHSPGMSSVEMRPWSSLSRKS